MPAEHYVDISNYGVEFDENRSLLPNIEQWVEAFNYNKALKRIEHNSLGWYSVIKQPLLL